MEVEVVGTLAVGVVVCLVQGSLFLLSSRLLSMVLSVFECFCLASVLFSLSV